MFSLYADDVIASSGRFKGNLSWGGGAGPIAGVQRGLVRGGFPWGSHHGALGGGEVDGADPHGQSFLQVVEDVGVDAGAGHRALGGWGLIQQLLETVQFDQQHHVLQEVALDKSRELRGPEELRHVGNSVLSPTQHSMQVQYMLSMLIFDHTS